MENGKYNTQLQRDEHKNQLMQESQIKSKAVKQSPRKKSEGIFVPFILSKRKLFNILVLSQCVWY